MTISEQGDERGEAEGMVGLRAAVRDHWAGLSAAERAVARYLADAPVERLLIAGAQELGAASGTSNATVVRTLQRLGYAGLPALKRELAAGAGHAAAVAPEARLRRRIAQVGRDLDHIWGDVLDEARDRLDRTRRLTEPAALRAAVTALADAGEVHAFGVAAAEPAARQLALALGRIGRRARFAGATGPALADDLLALRRGDAAVVFQPGRAPHELTVLVERARTVGARVVLVTDAPDGRFGDRVDAVLTAPHTPTGITSQALTALVVADVLLLALTTLEEERAVDASHQLAELREQLLTPVGKGQGRRG